MKVFLSYSINDLDQFVIPSIARKLQMQGFSVANGRLKLSENIDYQTQNEINTSVLFIGLITTSGNANQRVYKEWLYTLQYKIPAVLLVEDSYNLQKEWESHPNLIRFNRHEPETAINRINLNIDQSKATNNLLEAAPWILGGGALITLVNLLSKE